MTVQRPMSVLAAALAASIALPAAALAQEGWSTEWDANDDRAISEDEFGTGFDGSDAFGAWDRDDEVGLNEGEFASGVYSTWDADNDMRITEDEYEIGSRNWYGEENQSAFGDWDADGSGYVDRNEFGQNWGGDVYGRYDADGDDLISEDEFRSGVYGSADLDRDKVITVEEEGWFEGWFDGDDVAADIEEVGDVM